MAERHLWAEACDGGTWHAIASGHPTPDALCGTRVCGDESDWREWWNTPVGAAICAACDAAA